MRKVDEIERPADAQNYCYDCKYCLLEDTGYSNSTVDGTVADCLLNLNPGFPKDYWYGKEPTLAYAENCPRFTPGEPTRIDVDHEDGDLENYSNDPEIKQLLRKADCKE